MGARGLYYDTEESLNSPLTLNIRRNTLDFNESVAEVLARYMSGERGKGKIAANSYFHRKYINPQENKASFSEIYTDGLIDMAEMLVRGKDRDAEYEFKVMVHGLSNGKLSADDRYFDFEAIVDAALEQVR